MTLAHDMQRAGAPAHEPADTPSAGQIKSFVERIQRLNLERAAIVEDIGEVYAEIKSHGFDKAAVRRLVKRLETDPDDRSEADAIDELYWRAFHGSARP